MSTALLGQLDVVGITCGDGADEADRVPAGVHAKSATPMKTTPTTALAAAFTAGSDVADPDHGALQEIQDQTLLADLLVRVERPVARAERHHLVGGST